MKFAKIEQLAFFGGSRLLADFALFAAEKLPYKLAVWSAKRHLEEIVPGQKRTLREVLKRAKIAFYETDNINSDKNLRSFVNPRTLGIAFGAAWMFDRRIAKRFAKNHLLDFMGIDLPRYRGGAHYTWQILHGNKKACANLQVILGGAETFHRGPVIKRVDYELPASAANPLDFFDFMSRKEIFFLKNFFDEVKAGKNFKLVRLDERESSYYPPLSTMEQGWIDWNWSGQEIGVFIDAFSDPYPGASTLHRGKRVYIGGCEVLAPQENYHPFTFGMVVRKDKTGVFVATRGALLRLSGVKAELGDRLYTPMSNLETARQFSAVYDAKGLKR